MKRNLLITIFLFLVGVPALLALEVPDHPQGYVTDLAGLLSPEAKAQLETLLRQQEIQTSNQIVILTLPALAGDSIEDFSIRLAEKWKIGQKGKDNGIIFLIAKEEHQMRIEVGYGLEGVLPDSLAAAIIRNIVVPRFKAGEFEAGILTGTQAILEAIRGEFEDENAEMPAGDPLLPLFKFIGTAAALLFFLDSVRFGQYRIFHRAYSERYAFLESQGIKVLRFWSSHLRRHKEAIRDTIWRKLPERAPHPLPDYCRPGVADGTGNRNS